MKRSIEERIGNRALLGGIGTLFVRDNLYQKLGWPIGENIWSAKLFSGNIRIILCSLDYKTDQETRRPNVSFHSAYLLEPIPSRPT